MSNDPAADPFGESMSFGHRLSCHALGARCDFRSNSRALLALAGAAFSGLPRYRTTAGTVRFAVTLRLEPDAPPHGHSTPPPMRTYADAGLVYGVVDGANHVVISPARRSALVVISQGMLRFPYHVRYELIEFAIYVLATRSLQLIPLHAACVSRGKRGLLLVGNSGAGKSTLALHAMLGGLRLLSEDAVFADARTLLASAAPNFLHLRSSSLRALRQRQLAGVLRRAPIIRRRSGLEKHEVDLRHGNWPIARAAPHIAHVVFLSARRGTAGKLLRRVPKRQLRPLLAATQPYAARLGGWSAFCRRVAAGQAYVLLRGSSPAASVEALSTLL